jgi:hypothetical protein
LPCRDNTENHRTQVFWIQTERKLTKCERRRNKSFGKRFFLFLFLAQWNVFQLSVFKCAYKTSWISFINLWPFHCLTQELNSFFLSSLLPIYSRASSERLKFRISLSVSFSLENDHKLYFLVNILNKKITANKICGSIIWNFRWRCWYNNKQLTEIICKLINFACEYIFKLCIQVLISIRWSQINKTFYFYMYVMKPIQIIKKDTYGEYLFSFKKWYFDIAVQ